VSVNSTRYSWRQMLRIVWAVGWADFVLKYRGSFFGYLWSLALPAMKFLVIFHVFRSFVGGEIENYPLYLMLGLIVWEYFARVTHGCIAMLRHKEGVIQKVPFPRLILIFAVGWTDTIVFFTHCLIFLVLAWMMHVSPALLSFYTPLLLLQMLLLFLGTGMLLSAYSLRFRDIEHIWSMVLQVLFWLTPIMYLYTLHSPLSRQAKDMAAGNLPSTAWGLLDTFITFQPLSILIHDTRRVVLYSQTAGVPSAVHAAIFTAFCFLVFAAGTALFRYRSTYFLQEY